MNEPKKIIKFFELMEEERGHFIGTISFRHRVKIQMVAGVDSLLMESYLHAWMFRN